MDFYANFGINFSYKSLTRFLPPYSIGVDSTNVFLRGSTFVWLATYIILVMLYTLSLYLPLPVLSHLLHESFSLLYRGLAVSETNPPNSIGINHKLSSSAGFRREYSIEE